MTAPTPQPERVEYLVAVAYLVGILTGVLLLALFLTAVRG